MVLSKRGTNKGLQLDIQYYNPTTSHPEVTPISADQLCLLCPMNRHHDPVYTTPFHDIVLFYLQNNLHYNWYCGRFVNCYSSYCCIMFWYLCNAGIFMWLSENNWSYSEKPSFQHYGSSITKWYEHSESFDDRNTYY